jgi:hypothetical protein
MDEDRIAKRTNTVKVTETSELEMYMHDGGEKEKFKLVCTGYGKGLPDATLILPQLKFYDEDIPMLVAVILDLVEDQKGRAEDIYDKVQNIARAFIESNEAEETLAHSYKVGTSGRLEDVLVKGDE